MPAKFTDLTVTGSAKFKEDGISAQLRSSILKQSDNFIFPVPWTGWRVWDAIQTNLPGTAAADDLALIGGTFGTAPPLIQAGDLKAAGATSRYARNAEIIVPESYVAGESFALRFYSGMKTTVADVSCTLDIEAYQVDKIGGISADLCATALQSMNFLTFAGLTFVITPTTLEPGDWLDVRIAIACNDAATGTAVIPTIAAIDRVCDIQG